MSYVREIRNGVVDLAGRCVECGRQVESSAGCTPCWQRGMSEAATTVLVMKEESFFLHPTFDARKPVFAKLLVS